MSFGTLGGGWNATYRRERLATTVVVVLVVDVDDDVEAGIDVVVVVEVVEVVVDVVWVVMTPPGPTPDGPVGLLFSQATISATNTTLRRSSLRIGVALSNPRGQPDRPAN
jgi:hypothetical protein